MGERLTKGDIEKIQAEIEERKLVLRPKLLEEVKETRAQGDLSENFEYHEAKRAKNMNDSRIRYLEKMLKFAEVVDDSSADDEVGINNTVTIYIPEDSDIKVTSTHSSGDFDYELPFGKDGNNFVTNGFLEALLPVVTMDNDIGFQV